MKTNPTRQEVLRALADGLTVESCLKIGLAWTPAEFSDLAPNRFNACYWRILDPPAPKRLVPLAAEDVPPGSVIRFRGWKTTSWKMIGAVWDDRIECCDDTQATFQALQRDAWEISRDGGRSWQKCEKEEV